MDGGGCCVVVVGREVVGGGGTVDVVGGRVVVVVGRTVVGGVVGRTDVGVGRVVVGGGGAVVVGGRLVVGGVVVGRTVTGGAGSVVVVRRAVVGGESVLVDPLPPSVVVPAASLDEAVGSDDVTGSSGSLEAGGSTQSGVVDAGSVVLGTDASAASTSLPTEPATRAPAATATTKIPRRDECRGCTMATTMAPHPDATRPSTVRDPTDAPVPARSHDRLNMADVFVRRWLPSTLQP